MVIEFWTSRCVPCSDYRNKQATIVYFAIGQSSASSLQLCEDSRYNFNQFISHASQPILDDNGNKFFSIVAGFGDLLDKLKKVKW